MTNQELYASLDNNIGYPSQYGGTQAKWNMFDKSGNVLLSNNNRDISRNGGVGSVRATIPKSSGKWYWEIKINSGTTDNYIGVGNGSAQLTSNPTDINYWTIALDGGDYYHGGFLGVVGTATGTWPASTGEVFGIALNMDAGSMTIYRNNIALTTGPLFQGTTGPTGSIYPMFYIQNNSVTTTTNFGPTGMSYSPPAGYNVGVYS